MATFKIYQPFDQSDIISGKTNVISSGFFPGGEISMSQSSFRTSSAQTKGTGSNGIYDVLNGMYYTNVYNPSVANPQILFSISYGDFYGGGVKTGSVFKNTKAIYSQFKNLLLGTVDQDGLFSFKTGSSASSTYITSSEIFVLSFSSDLMRDQIDRGQWAFTISGANTSGSLHLVDEYAILTEAEKKEQRLVYQIVSGSFDDTTGQSVGLDSYHGLGLFYPKNGIMILNAEKIKQYAGHSYNNSTSSAVDVFNHRNLFSKIHLASGVMRLRKSELVPSTHYFVRVKNQDFNFSNNPSFVYQTATNGHSKGEIITSLQVTPKSYITTVGLYNEMNELLAIAKLSRPSRKAFDSELLVRIRLDF